MDYRDIRGYLEDMLLLYDDFNDLLLQKEKKARLILHESQFWLKEFNSRGYWINDVKTQQNGVDLVLSNGLKVDIKGELETCKEYFSISIYRKYDKYWKDVVSDKATDLWIILVEHDYDYLIFSINKKQMENIIRDFPKEQVNYNMYNWECDHLNYISAEKAGGRAQMQIPFNYRKYGEVPKWYSLLGRINKSDRSYHKNVRYLI